MNIKLTILKLLFGGVNDLVALLDHVRSALAAESLKLHAEADALAQQSNMARAQADAAGNLVRKLS